jgi:hypothetical protein
MQASSSDCRKLLQGPEQQPTDKSEQRALRGADRPAAVVSHEEVQGVSLTITAFCNRTLNDNQLTGVSMGIFEGLTKLEGL